MSELPHCITRRTQVTRLPTLPAQRGDRGQARPGTRANPWRLVVYPQAFEAICADRKTVEPRSGYKWLAWLRPGEYIEFLRHIDKSDPNPPPRQRVVAVVTRATPYRTLADLCQAEALSAMKPGFENDHTQAWTDLRWGITPKSERIALVAIEFERVAEPVNDPIAVQPESA